MSTKESTPKALSGRKTHAIKRGDAEPLTREDLQYDLLRHIFDDQHAVFTDPFGNGQTGSNVTFRDLYVNSLVRSPRSSKAVRDKINESAAFGTDFAMMSLLANVGRINTTMAFFPETRTALRTYHPVPALQKTDGNLQDAPRIKNALKACMLPTEAKGAPTTPSDILLQRASHVPSTSVVNLIFVLNNHSGAVGRSHFDEESGLEFTDLFLPVPIPSAARAKVFLWLCFHYLEAPGQPNPYEDAHSRSYAGRAPRLLRLSADVVMALHENVDTPEEVAWGARMTEHRRTFLVQDKVRQEAVAAVAREEAGAGAGSSEHSTGTPPGRPINPKAGRKGKALPGVDPPLRGRPTKHQSREALTHNTSHQVMQPDTTHTAAPGEPYPRLPLPGLQPVPGSSASVSVFVSGAKPKTGRGRKKQGQQQSPERTMLEHAWHIVSTKDALIESDEENGEHVRLDYMRRLKTLRRLRGKSPTPEPQQLPPAAMDVTSEW